MCWARARAAAFAVFCGVAEFHLRRGEISAVVRTESPISSRARASGAVAGRGLSAAVVPPPPSQPLVTCRQLTDTHRSQSPTTFYNCGADRASLCAIGASFLCRYRRFQRRCGVWPASVTVDVAFDSH